jgi:protein SCO1/2
VTRILAIGAGIAIALGAALSSRLATRDSRLPLRLPFYQTADRTPEWITQGTVAYARIHRVADFSLTDQDGNTITRADVAGKIYVASFFYTACQQLCPTLRSNLAKVQAAFRDDDRVLILSHSVAPEHDDTAALRRYASTNGMIRGKWHLLTGPTDEISRLERESYFAQLPDSVNGEPVRSLHSETFVLVDEQGRVRGVYDGSLAYDTERLIADIHTLK